MKDCKLFVLEELGFGNTTVEVYVGYDISPSEPMTLEYPGCDGEVVMTSWVVMSYTNGDVLVKRAQRPDWFDWLDVVVERLMLKNEDVYLEKIIETHNSDDSDDSDDDSDDSDDDNGEFYLMSDQFDDGDDNYDDRFYQF